MVLVLRSRALGPTLTAPAGELWPFRARLVRDARLRLSPASPFSFRQGNSSCKSFSRESYCSQPEGQVPTFIRRPTFPPAEQPAGQSVAPISRRRPKVARSNPPRGGSFFPFLFAAERGLSRCGHQHAGSRGRHGHVAAAAAAARRGVLGSTSSTSSTSSKASQ
jgi:hypothetical protein